MNTLIKPPCCNGDWTHVQELSKQIQIPLSYMSGMIVFTNPDANLINVNCNCCFTVDRLYEAILMFNQQLFTEQQVEKSNSTYRENGYK